MRLEARRGKEGREEGRRQSPPSLSRYYPFPSSLSLPYLLFPHNKKHITHDVETMLSCCVHAINKAPGKKEEERRRRRDYISPIVLR